LLNRNDIIGQQQLLDRIDSLINSNNFPRFAIIVGPQCAGKKLIANYISDHLSCMFVPSSIKIDSVRDVIDSSYQVMNKVCYMFADADDMSISAKNALLKVTEEPPLNSYFIITLKNTENMLPTILSRGTQFFLQPYTDNELYMYGNNKSFMLEDITTKMCSTPGEIDMIIRYGEEQFLSFADSVLDNIGKANISNVLKLSNNFAIKKDDSKYDINLFLHCIMALCLERYKNNADKRYNLLCVNTCNVLSEFHTSSVSKLAVLDKWLIMANDILSNNR
jgi:replication-associated recombination protein RarA